MRDGDVYLSWKDPKDTNGIVRFYYIRVFDTETGQQVQNLVNKTAMKRDPTRWQLISNLKPFTDYTFIIQAVTIKAGEMANFTARTEEGGIYDSSPFLQSTLITVTPSGPSLDLVITRVRFSEVRCDENDSRFVSETSHVLYKDS